MNKYFATSTMYFDPAKYYAVMRRVSPGFSEAHSYFTTRKEAEKKAKELNLKEILKDE